MAAGITRKEALTNAIALANYANMEAIKIEGKEDANWLLTVETLSKMLEQVNKPRKAAVSKARKANEYLASKVAELCGDEVTTKDVVALGLPDIMTTQKAAAVLRVACEKGLFEKFTEGKKVSYRKVY